MFRRIVLASVVAAGVFGIAAAAQAAGVVANYQFPEPGEPGNLSSDTDPNSTAGPLSPHASLFGFSRADNAPGSTAGGSRVARTDLVANDQAGSLAGDDYFAFTLTPAPGYQAAFITLTASIGAVSMNTGSGFDPVTASFFLRSSVDGYAADIDAIRSVTAPGGGPGALAGALVWADVSFDLSALAPQAGPVEFRLYLFDDGGFTYIPGPLYSTGFDVLDNVILNADVTPIPEPSALALAALATPWLLMRRRGA